MWLFESSASQPVPSGFVEPFGGPGNSCGVIVHIVAPQRFVNPAESGIFQKAAHIHGAFEGQFAGDLAKTAQQDIPAVGDLQVIDTVQDGQVLP